VLHSAIVCCSVMQCVKYIHVEGVNIASSVVVAVYSTVLQCVALCRSVLQ